MGGGTCKGVWHLADFFGHIPRYCGRGEDTSCSGGSLALYLGHNIMLFELLLDLSVLLDMFLISRRCPPSPPLKRYHQNLPVFKRCV